jgi:hypothetical protein
MPLTAGIRVKNCIFAYFSCKQLIRTVKILQRMHHILVDVRGRLNFCMFPMCIPRTSLLAITLFVSSTASRPRKVVVNIVNKFSSFLYTVPKNGHGDE